VEGLDSIQIRPGLAYITLLGFNKLRLAAGLEPLAPRAGEPVADFKARVKVARAEFQRDYWHLWPEGYD
jgi:hypothetical protein